MARIQRILVSIIMRSGPGILLLQRAKPYSEFLQQNPETQVGVGLWELPGGSSDFGETPQQAVVRETAEETGLSIEEQNLKLAACCAYTLTGSGCESHRIHIVYDVFASTPLQGRHSKEHAAHQWVQDQGALQGLAMISEVRDVIARRL
jgi:8-oxo-dGTP pyrophosphatase MutT (NUDIX family)